MRHKNFLNNILKFLLGSNEMKKKLFLLMTDLDQTIYPASLKQLGNLVESLKKIEDKENVEVRFCPISARPSGYVLSKMDDLDKYFNDAKLKGGVGFGAAENGGVIVYAKNEPFRRTFLYPQEKIAYMM
jgi:hypothetical protein